tara:strand:- start:6299 stop:6511 length:213 start_codon:yes stop_codon:yes gene_type:complete
MNTFSFTDDELYIIEFALTRCEAVFDNEVISNMKTKIAKIKSLAEYCSCKKYKNNPKDGFACARCNKQLF